VAALLSLWVFIIHPSPVAYAYWLLVWVTLLFVVIYDLKHMIIPWSCSLFLAVLSLGGLVFGLVGQTGVWAFAAGPLLALPLFLLSLVSRGRWMGWGDSALELSLGWFLGLMGGLTALMLAFWIGSVIGIALILWQRFTHASRGFTINSEIPFAPFLVLGALVVYFLHVDFFSSISFFW
jgi:leader peptidase (prepilin peptidase)/N-methyltransferase